MNMQLRPIGLVHSTLKKLSDCPLLENENAPEAVIEIFDVYRMGIKDIKQGSELILFTWLNQADRTVLTTRQRNNPNAAMTGVFSTRSPDRPNPVGIHYVQVIAITENDQIHVSGLEVLDRTPVVDIKPVLKR